MNWDLNQLLTTQYFFEQNPGGEFIPGYALLIFFILLLFLPGMIQKMANSNKALKKTVKKGLGKFIFLGIIGIILVASRFSAVPSFSMRLWLYLTLGTTLVCGTITFVKMIRAYRTRVNSMNREKEKRS